VNGSVQVLFLLEGLGVGAQLDFSAGSGCNQSVRSVLLRAAE
jgi:hypothetical protein